MKEYKKYNSIYDWLSEISTNYPKRVALIERKKRITFAQLKRYSDSIANYLVSYGIKKGESVGIFLPNGWEYVAILFAISKIGAVAVPINDCIKSKELSVILDDAKIKLFFAHDSLIHIVKGSIAAINYGQVVWVGKDVKGTRFKNILTLSPLVKTNLWKEDDLAMIFYTSGTSGESKGVMLSNKNVLFSVDSTREFFNVNKKDRVFLMLPMFHSYSLITAVLTPLLSGTSIYIANKERSFNLLSKIVESKATIFLGIPDIYHALYKLELPFRFRFFNKIKIFVSGAAPLHRDILETIEKKFKKSKLIEGYGLTEATGAVTANSLEARKIGSVGKALPNVEIKIVSNTGKECKANEVGEILVKSDGIMLGYLNKDELTANRLKNGWLHTKDLGYFDEDGFLFLKGRKSELIIFNGLNIYPLEIESVLDRFEGVKKSAVIGYKSSKNIEKIVAFIELERGEDISIKKLDEYARGFLADYKIPHKYVIIDKLPRNSTGKIIKAELENYALINIG
jgi:long-chain acyl-CoA synthetase